MLKFKNSKFSGNLFLDSPFAVRNSPSSSVAPILLKDLIDDETELFSTLKSSFTSLGS